MLTRSERGWGRRPAVGAWDESHVRKQTPLDHQVLVFGRDSRPIRARRARPHPRWSCGTSTSSVWSLLLCASVSRRASVVSISWS